MRNAKGVAGHVEKEVTGHLVARLYEKSGVPTLEPGDIYPEDGLADSMPISAWLLQRNQDREELLKPVSVAASALPSGIRWRDGKLLKTWGSDELSRGRLSWSPRQAAYGAGVCLLRIDSGTRTYSARVVLR